MIIKLNGREPKYSMPINEDKSRVPKVPSMYETGSLAARYAAGALAGNSAHDIREPKSSHNNN